MFSWFHLKSDGGKACLLWVQSACAAAELSAVLKLHPCRRDSRLQTGQLLIRFQTQHGLSNPGTSESGNGKRLQSQTLRVLKLDFDCSICVKRARKSEQLLAKDKKNVKAQIKHQMINKLFAGNFKALN